MNNQNNIRSVLNNHKIIPVVTFTNKEDIQPIVESLLDQQIKCIEVTLRNSISRDAVEVIKNIYGDKIAVGVGTVLNKSDVLFSQENNVDFMVSPGATKNLINEFENSKIPYLPGVSTVNNVMELLEMDCNTLKFFPALLSGGVNMLKQFNNLFRDVNFCPTGGINEFNYNEFLSLPNVVSVGGSWVIKNK